MAVISTNPKGKTFSIRSYENGEFNWTDYEVTLVSGLKRFVPTSESVVYLRTIGRPSGVPAPFLSIPLDTFIEMAVPAQVPAIKPQSKSDVFWEV